MLDTWSSFFQGELGAAAALAGLLFVSVSVNQAKILELGRMADRGLEALGILFLIIMVTSLPLVPGQPLRLLGAEILVLGTIAVATCKHPGPGSQTSAGRAHAHCNREFRTGAISLQPNPD